MAWDGDWLGDWDGYWFGHSATATVSLSAELAGTASLTATLTVIDVSVLREGAIQIPARMHVGYELAESMLVGIQLSASMSYDYESSGHWMSAAFTVGNSMEQWVTPIGTPMGEYDDIFELQVEMDVDAAIAVSMTVDTSVGASMSSDTVSIVPAMARPLLAGMSMADEYNITMPLIMG